MRTSLLLSIAVVAIPVGLRAQRPDPAPPLPSVTLPAALDRVLRDYETAWRRGDAAALAALFAEDGFVLQGGRPPVRGRAAIQQAYTGPGGAPLQLRALAFATADTIGHIIGAYRYDGDSTDQGKFTLTLRRAANGRWLIFSDMDNTSRPSRPPGPAPTAPPTAPRVDIHQQLVSPAFAPIARLPERNGAALVRELDAAGIQRAVVLSVGYSFGDERKALPDPDALTRAENDWTSAEVRQHPTRLVGFCSANPLRAAARAELERCLALPGMVGIKLHLGNGGISLRDTAHKARVQAIVSLAEARRTPVLVHLRARGGTDFGAADARIFLDDVVSRAPNTEFVVAHLGASSPGYDTQNDEVMAVLAAAAARQDPRMTNVFVDVAANITTALAAADAALVARRIRQLGVARVLYGSDLSPPGGSIRSGWEAFRSTIPLNDAEFQQIARNQPRFLQ